MDLLLLGNLVSFVGALFMIAVGFFKERRRILLVQSVQFAVMGAGNLILGGLSGFISNMLGIVRNLFCLGHTLTLPLAAAFVAVQAALTLPANDQGPVGWLPVLAALIFTAVINTKNETLLKLSIIAGQLCWAVYDAHMRNYASLIFDILTMFSNLWGIFALRRSEKSKQSSEGKTP